MTNVWVWVGLIWNDRVRFVLDRYGDRLTDVSIFGWAVDLDGSLTRTFNPAQLDTYRQKWPHIRWWGCFRNMDAPSGASAYAIFQELRFNPIARNRLATDVGKMLDDYPWLHGVDIDLEGGGNLYAVESEEVVRRVANVARQRSRKVSAALPALTSSGSVGGENWVRYRQLGELLDHVSVMSYDMAWNGSAPGPISPGFWMRDVYSWATSQIAPEKLSMGLPAYARAWVIHDEPTGQYRGTSGTYYAARLWLDGTWTAGPGDVDQPQVAWLAYRDPEGVPFGYLGVYDWMPPQGHVAGTNSGITYASFENRDYAVRYGRAAGNPIWSVADNSDPTAGADYVIRPQQVRDIYGNWVGPKHGINLTLEMLQRAPDSATILDDDARTDGQMSSSLYSRVGTWTHWRASSEPRALGQYRTTGGRLTFGRNFGTQALHVQARAQLPAPGFWGVHIGNVRAEINQDGLLRITVNGTTVASMQTSAPGTSSTPSSARSVVGLRVRGTHVRAYAARSETSVPLRLEADVDASALDGTAGVWASGSAWFDHIRLGDGWWYQPREAIEVSDGVNTWLLGRIPRSGVTWDSAGRFRPDLDVEESETRTESISADWTFKHIQQFPIVAGQQRTIRVRQVDVDVWLGRIFACDAEGARILYYGDAEYLARWGDHAVHDYGLQGIAIWALGQEDVRFWERIKGAELPLDAVIA